MGCSVWGLALSDWSWFNRTQKVLETNLSPMGLGSFLTVSSPHFWAVQCSFRLQIHCSNFIRHRQNFPGWTKDCSVSICKFFRPWILVKYARSKQQILCRSFFRMPLHLKTRLILVVELTNDLQILFEGNRLPLQVHNIWLKQYHHQAAFVRERLTTENAHTSEFRNLPFLRFSEGR